jgi:hypothetical protein
MHQENPIYLWEERRKSNIFGVVLFILDDQNRVFTLQEMEADEKTGKIPGKYGVICEKRTGSEESWAANMWRAIQEETKIPDSEICNVIDFPYPTPERLFETQFVEGVWATVVVLRCKNSKKFMELVEANKLPENNPVPDEVRPIGFLSKEKFEKLELRSGVRNIMDKFGENIFNHKI